jgi:starch synthase
MAKPFPGKKPDPRPISPAAASAPIQATPLPASKPGRKSVPPAAPAKIPTTPAPTPVDVPTITATTSVTKGKAAAVKPAAPVKAEAPAPVTSKSIPPAATTAKKKAAKEIAKSKVTETIPPPIVVPASTAKSVVAPAPPAAKFPVKVDLTTKAAGKVRKPAARIKTGRTEPSKPATNDSAKRLLFITSECTPLAQTGGLGDAVAGLTKALRKRGHDVRIVMPLYSVIDRAKFGITFSRSCCVHFGEGEEIWVGIFEGKLDGEVPIWFIDYARYFDRPGLYGHGDDAYRFGVLSKGALQLCKDVDFIPHVVHVHDWMSSMASVFLKTWDRVLSPLSNTASVLTIHNIGYQGKFDPSVLRFYGLGGEYMRPDRLEDFGEVNLLKAGIQYSDVVTTVSPTYAQEIRGPVGGMGLAPYLNNRAENLFGVLNGVDTTVWNPETDKYLPARYSRTDLAGKAACKRALQERFGLTVDPKIPIFAIISRFAPQKGFDLLRGALPQALRDMVMQVVVLGTGDSFTENFFRWLSSAYPAKANAHIGFAPEIAHLIEAGSDFFLMPSIYEPCGLNQMYSSLYGTLPVVRATGGLEDTVENYDEAAGRGTGFKFWEISDRALYFTIGWAVSTWFDRPEHHRAMQQQGMARDFTWNASAGQYEKLYDHAIAQRAAL